MSSLLLMTQRQLASAGYSVTTNDDRDGSIVLFESDSILGFVLFFPDAATLLEGWGSASQRVLQAAQFALRRAERKAWNAYLIFLTDGVGDYAQNIEIGAIEENLVGTRKLAKAGVSNVEDLRLALLPLLAIQNAPRLDAIDMPLEIRMRTTELPTELIEAFLGGASESILTQLLETSQ